MNTLIENDGDVTRVRLIPTNDMEKLALRTIAAACDKGQNLVFKTQAAGPAHLDYVLELVTLRDERQASNG